MLNSYSLNRSPQSLTSWLWVALAAYLLATYLPLIAQAGISVDDWGDIAHNLDCSSFWDCYGAWFPLFSNRPLAPLPITLLTFAFGDWYWGYLLVNSLLYLLAIGLCAQVIKGISSCASATMFVLFAAVPMIAMPLITSPINQSTATLSFVFWALSLLSLWHFLQSSLLKYWFLTYVLLLLAFLTYEVILPLLVLTSFLPWIHDRKKFHVLHVRYWAQFIAPIVVVLAIVTLWQKGIAPQFMSVDSRLKFEPSNAVAKLHTFFHVFYKQIPTLFMKMPGYLQWGGILTTVLGVATFFIAQKSLFSNPINPSKNGRFFIIATLCLLASSFIFILSDESAVSGGYEARGLSSTWFAFALFLAAIYSQNIILHKIVKMLLGAFLALCILCFSVQRSQTIAAWKMQLDILQDVNQQLRALNPPNGAVILGDVPHYLPNNYNNEIVFSQPWDFGAAIALTNQNRFIAGPVIDSSRGRWNQLHINNGIVHAQNFSGAPLENLWIYHYDPIQGKGSLSPIQTPAQFMQLYATSQKQYELLAR
jgi:hypothetical protein